jgi:hypothetical protein
MDIKYVIEAELYDLDGILPGAEEFLRRYAPNRSGKTTTFVFSDERKADEAFSFLATLRLKADRFYSFRLADDEVPRYPAIYLGIKIVDSLLNNDTVNEALMEDCDLALDYQSERIVAALNVRGLLEGSTRGLRWSALRHSGTREFMSVDITERLPEPIIIPVPIEVSPNEEPPGTFAVRSDGRDIITRNNVLHLSEVGVAISEEVKVVSRTVRCRPRCVASGAVIHNLQANGVRGLLEPLTPLILESDRLAPVAASQTGDPMATSRQIRSPGN